MQETWIWSRSPGKGNGYPFQYSCLENSLDWRAWRAIVCGVTNSLSRLSNFRFTSLQNRFTGLTFPLIFLGCSFEIVPARCSHLNQDRNVYSLWQRFPSSQSRECPEISQVKNLHPCGRCANYAVLVRAPDGAPGLPSLSAMNWRGSSLSSATLRPRTTNQSVNTWPHYRKTRRVITKQRAHPLQSDPTAWRSQNTQQSQGETGMVTRKHWDDQSPDNFASTGALTQWRGRGTQQASHGQRHRLCGCSTVPEFSVSPAHSVSMA